MMYKTYLQQIKTNVKLLTNNDFIKLKMRFEKVKPILNLNLKKWYFN